VGGKGSNWRSFPQSPKTGARGTRRPLAPQRAKSPAQCLADAGPITGSVHSSVEASALRCAQSQPSPQTLMLQQPRHATILFM